MPDAMPDRLEAGTVNAPGLAGLDAGLAYVMDRGPEAIHAHEAGLKALLRSGLEDISSVRVLSPPAPDGVGIVTLNVDGIDAGALAHRLEKEWGVQGRAGLHCAPECHALIGSADTGALRFSVGWASTPEDVNRALEAVEAIAGHKSRRSMNHHEASKGGT